MEKTIFDEIMEQDVDDFFAKPKPLVKESPDMTSQEVEEFLKRITFHPKSNEIKNEVVSDLFANSDIDMTTEEFGKFAKNFSATLLDFNTPKSKSQISKKESKNFKPKSIWSAAEIEEIINLIRKIHPEKIYNNTKENNAYIIFTTIGTSHTYGMCVCDALNSFKLREVLNKFPKEHLGMTFNTFTHYKSKNKINSIFYVNNLVIDIDFKKAGYENSDQVMFFLENDFFRKELPEPNFIETGNQMKLIYTLEEPIKIPKKKNGGIKLFLKVVMNKLASKLKNFGADNIGINYYIRVPGSINTKSVALQHSLYGALVTIQKYSDYKWSLQDLVDEFLPSLPSWYKNKQTLKKERNPKQLNRFNFTNRSKIILSDLEKIQKRCNEIENSGHRELLCFLYRNYSLLAGFSSKEALESMLKFNENFNVPLIERQVISHTNNVDRKQYKYSNVLLMRELEITEQEAKDLELEAIRGRKIYTKEERSEYNHKYYVAHRQNDLSLKERVQKIKEVVLENKLKKVSNKAIRALLETVHKINLSLKSIERYVTKLIKKNEYIPI